MTTLLESELRTALRNRADLVAPTSVVRLAQVDYRPRARRVRPPVALGAVGASAAAAGTAIAIVSLGTGASNAFAGWTAKPTTPLPAQLVSANQDCQSRSPVAGLPLKLTDTRGPFTFAVYANDTASATCITGPSFTAAAGSSASAPVAVPAGKILLSTHQTSREGQSYSFADGRAGAGVSAVKLNLDDGTTVDATVGGGWFVAWWPSTHEVKSAEVTTPSGVSTQNFPIPPNAPNSPAGAYGAGFSSSAGSGGGSQSGSFGVSR
jgi:hypothetical protein